MNLRDNSPNKMAKEMHSKQHKFQGFPEISRSFIYSYSHSKEKMAMWNVNDISWARDWTQVCYIFPAQRSKFQHEWSIAVDKK